MKEFTPKEEADLREALKRCSPATIEAACAFRRTGNLAHLPVLVHGIIERYVKRDLLDRLQQRSPDDLLLGAHLGIDSLTMLEIVLLAEDVLQISIHSEDLRPLRTLGDIQRFIEVRLRPPLIERGLPEALKTARA